MLVRYFAAARAAAGVEAEHLDLPDGTTLDGLIAAMLAVERPDGTLSLAGVIARSSFLRNEVALRDRHAALDARDVVDVLPPFAGG
jgi:molybdopterin converting factor small subunit